MFIDDKILNEIKRKLKNNRDLSTMKAFFWYIFLISGFLSVPVCTYADAQYISLRDAENLALKTSNEIKAFVAQTTAANEQAGFAFAPLLPYWTAEGYYQYNTHVPTVELPAPLNLGGLAVGTHTPYSIGTTIVYTLWDTFTNLNAYKGAKYLAKSQKETEENTRQQVLLDTRLAYLKVQLSLEEMRAVERSLIVVRSQFDDMDKRYHAGTVAELDWVDSKREVLNYEVQYEQQRITLTNNVKDLFALLMLPTTVEIFEPESEHNIPVKSPPKLKFDSLESVLEIANQWPIEPPSEKQPLLKSQTLLAQSYFAQADSEFGKYFPKIDISANSQIMYPDIIQLQQAFQNSFRASFSVPVFDGLRIQHRVANLKQDALSAQFNHDQIRINFDRDYQKSVETLENLKIQQEINQRDIEAAQKVAKLYYESYKGGQSLLVNVQRANLQVLTTQVQGARISANIINQLFQLQYLSGKINL